MMSMPRPTCLLPEMALSAARKLATDLYNAGLIEDDQREEAAADIARFGRPYMDGYDLAKRLDAYASLDCTALMVELLDTFGSYAREEIEAAQKAWCAAEGIRPTYTSQTHVRLKSGETGIITGIHAYGAAKYEIAMDDDVEAWSKAQRRRIVNFEDVTPVGKGRAAA